MPAIDFPASPAVNDEYSFEGRTWRWNGTGWEVKEYPAALLAGTAANPSLYFSGDPNTGLYSPGADQVAISTGGTGRLFVDASGTVLLKGTERLAFNTYVSDANHAGFVGRDIVTGALIIEAQNAGGGYPMTFRTNSAERVRITDAGNVGIGTSSPESLLHLETDGTALRVVRGSAIGFVYNTGTASTDAFRIQSNSGSVDLYSPSGQPVTISAGGTEKARITSAGNVGIGTSSPSSALDVEGIITAKSGAFDAGGFLNKYGSDANSKSWWVNSDTHGYGDFAIRQSTTRTGSTYDTKLLITSSGNVGIGTSSPSTIYRQTLNGDGSSIIGGLSFRNNGTETLVIGNPVFANDVDSEIWNPRNGYLRFATNNAERLRIDSSGRLLVGTSSAGSVLTTTIELASAGANNSQPAYQVYSFPGTDQINTGYFLFFRSRGSSVGTNTIVASGDRLGMIRWCGANGTSYDSAAEIFAEVDGTPSATNDMPGRLVFSTTADGASTSTERMRIDSAGTTTLTSATSTAPFIAKISTTEVARIDSSGRLLVGTSTARTAFYGTTLSSNIFQIEKASDSAGATFFADANNSDACGFLLFGKSRGTSLGSNTVVQSGDILGALTFAGSDGTKPVNAALIVACVDGTPGTNDMPGRLVFSTTADGASSPTERLRIDSAGVLQVADAGNISVGTTTGTKIGTATTQKLGFYNKTPVVQPAAVADATDAASVITQLNALLARMRDLGLIAT